MYVNRPELVDINWSACEKNEKRMKDKKCTQNQQNQKDSRMLKLIVLCDTITPVLQPITIWLMLGFFVMLSWKKSVSVVLSCVRYMQNEKLKMPMTTFYVQECVYQNVEILANALSVCVQCTHGLATIMYIVISINSLHRMSSCANGFILLHKHSCSKTKSCVDTSAHLYLYHTVFSDISNNCSLQTKYWKLTFADWVKLLKEL